MTRSVAPELHRPVAIERIGSAGLDYVVEASAAECTALARRLGLPAVLALSCRFHLRPLPGSVFAARGTLTARIVQTCVVSLDEFEITLQEEFALRFVRAGNETADPDPESDDEIPFDGTMIDLGEAAAEQLALALDPYPRKPDAELPASEAGYPVQPFARLAALRARH